MALVTPAQLRTMPLLDDPDTFTDDLLADLVEEFTALAERYRGVSPVPATATVTLYPQAYAGRRLELPHVEVTEVTAVTAGDRAFTVDEVAAIDLDSRHGAIGWWAGGTPVVVTYEHGLTEPPAGLARACKEWVRSKALASVGDMPRNTIGWRDDSGFTYRESTADWDAGRPTGLLVVDDALNAIEDRRIMGVR